MPPNPRTVARVATGLVSAAVALMLLAFCVVVPMQAQQAARLADDRGHAKPCAVSTLCTCQSNEMQIGQAMIQYLQDYDQKFPIGTQQRRSKPTSSYSGVGWAGQVYPYLNVTAPFTCPDDFTPQPKTGTVVSYGFNANYAGLSPHFYAPNAPFNQQPYDTSETVLLFEISGDPVQVTLPDEGASQGARVFSAAGDGTDLHLFAGRRARLDPSVLYATGLLGMRPKASGPVSQEPSPTGRHDRGANYLLADGHAQWDFPADVSSGKTGTSTSGIQTGSVHGIAAGIDTPPYQITFSLN